MSGHNADFIPDAHHAFTKKQLTELLTRYGKISELWFDMGANTPEQSRELYQLVHQLNPTAWSADDWETTGPFLRHGRQCLPRIQSANPLAKCSLYV